jgi:hypothetical protein
MGRQPTRPRLIGDLDQRHCFADQPQAGGSCRAA